MSFKAIWRVLLPLLGAWLLSATAANAMFLSTDPVGTRDDPNLYMYVGLDPVNLVDPTGECKTTKNPDGTTTDSGVCGIGPDAEAFVADRISDPDSQAGNWDAAAIASGDVMYVRFAERTVGTSNQPSQAVDGGAHQGIALPDGRTAAAVTIDRGDLDQTGPRIAFAGTDAATGNATTYFPDARDVFEHEGNHGNETITGVPRDGGTEARAVAAENRYRQQAGNPFRRQGHLASWIP